MLSVALAESFARTALANVVREYPGKPDHVLGSPQDLRGPREWHPAFYGSFDWHSCVHMHWLLARVRRLHPGLAQRAQIDGVFGRHITVSNVAAECAYLERPEAKAFERTYGWSWLLELARELMLAGDRSLAPLADAIVARYLDYLPRQRYPLRQGLHANSAFGLAFAIDYARAANRDDLLAACTAAALRWFGGDRDVPAAWEPSGADFLSPALTEADAMRRVLPASEFPRWLAQFLPDLATDFSPAIVDDRTDPFIVHLDGLNLSRAWNMQHIAAALPADDARVDALRGAARMHLDAGLAGLASGAYEGEHWLATFAVLALTAGVPDLSCASAC